MNFDEWYGEADKKYRGTIINTKDILKVCWEAAQNEQRQICADAVCEKCEPKNREACTVYKDEDHCWIRAAILHAGEEA
jgi:hypothetical protein